MLPPVQRSQLKLSIRQMRRAVLIATLEKKGAKFLPINIDQQLLMGKSDKEIYDLLLSKQTFLFKAKGWVQNRRSGS